MGRDMQLLKPLYSALSMPPMWYLGSLLALQPQCN